MPNRQLKYPDDVTRMLQRRWTANRSQWLAGGGRWPMALALGQPVQADVRSQMDAVREWVRAWQTPLAAGEVEWQERQWSELGRQQLPARLILRSPDEVAAWAGEERAWRQARERHNRLRDRWPSLSPGLGKYFDVLADYSDDDFQRLTTMLAWLVEHPSSGLFPRQLPIAGIDSKWLESRRGLIAELVGALRGIRAAAADFFSCCGLRPPPDLVRLAILDEALRARIGGLRDLTAPVPELARLDLFPTCVFIVENVQSGLAIDDLEGTIVVMGLGYRVDVLGRLPWIERAKAFYWGDIDTHGFAMLSRARGYLPHLESLLMDDVVLQANRDLCVAEKQQHGAQTLPNLSTAELAVYRHLKAQTWGFPVRLEQERIP